MSQEEKVFISEGDCYLFGQGTHYDIYKKLGAHITEKNGKRGVFFAVWAPNAERVFVIGSFNDWQEDQYPMEKIGDIGIYAAFVRNAKEGDMYKFLIHTKDGSKLYKADPYANYAELRPGTASIVTDITNFKWSDTVWMNQRAEKNVFKEPMAIYECHVGSWMRHPGARCT